MCLTVLVVLVILLYLLYRDSKKPNGFPPGPVWYPIIGCHFEIKLLSKKLGFHYLVLETLSKNYGPVVGLRLGRDRIVLISKQEHVKKILLREEFDGRPDGFFFRMRSFQKRLGVVFVDGTHFQEQKRFCLTALKRFGMGKQIMEDIILKETEELIATISQRCKNDAVLQMNNIFDVTVLNSLWSLMTGRRFDLEDEKLCELTGLVHESFRLLDMSGGVLNQMPFLRFVAPNATGYNRIRFVLDRFENFLRETVMEHEKSTGKEANNLIDLFLEEMRNRTDKNSSFTAEQLIILLLDLFMAGSETTSNSLVMAILYMMIYPEIQSKVQMNIDMVVPVDRLPTLQDRQRLGYVEAVLLEVLRHSTVVPVSVAHRSVREVEYQGYVIPKDAIVLVNLRSVLMDKDHWGDPENFRPERFQDENGQITHDDWFYPFGQGKRRCLGEGLARATMFLVFAGIMQNFRVLQTEKTPSLIPQDGITLSPRPFEARISPRKNRVNTP
ncbi:UNVERIFIED_CONTAM: hypothetical protein PYX00_010079 [Menopon gallinae]|uniref:Cytochrome P450 n=1 Tax=Menopon gallinae TaxID=328185 RepID=A0AAW2HDY4_9NEOP